MKEKKMTMRERIMQGKLFTDECEGLPEERLAAKKRMKAFNDSAPDETEKRQALLTERAAVLLLLWDSHFGWRRVLH